MFIDYDNSEYKIEIIRKNNKNLYIRVTKDLNINITCPYFYTDKMIQKIINDNYNDVIKMIEKQKQKSINKDIDDNCFLGKKLNVIYKEVKKPIYENYNLIVKDNEMLNKWYKKKSIEIFRIYLDEAYEVFEENIPYPKLKVRDMKTRWGVNNKRDNSITLNLELIKKDQEYLNYVIVHELSHFVHFNHSKAFWNIVEKYCPDYKRVRKELKER